MFGRAMSILPTQSITMSITSPKRVMSFAFELVNPQMPIRSDMTGSLFGDIDKNIQYFTKANWAILLEGNWTILHDSKNIKN